MSVQKKNVFAYKYAYNNNKIFTFIRKYTIFTCIYVPLHRSLTAWKNHRGKNIACVRNELTCIMYVIMYVTYVRTRGKTENKILCFTFPQFSYDPLVAGKF